MCPGAVCLKVSGGTEETADLVDVGDGPGNHHACDERPAAAWEKSASKRKGSERVSGNVHGQWEAESPFVATASRGISNLSALGTIENSTGRRAKGSPSSCA